MGFFKAKEVFKIKGDLTLEEKYKGAGYALAVAEGDKLIDFKYLRDIHDDLDVDSDEELLLLLDDPRLRPTIDNMRERGAVYIGMCSCYEFIVL